MDHVKQVWKKLFGGVATLQETEFQVQKSKKGQVLNPFAVAQEQLPFYKQAKILKPFLVATFITSLFFVVLPKLSYVLEHKEKSVIREMQKEQFQKEAAAKKNWKLWILCLTLDSLSRGE